MPTDPRERVTFEDDPYWPDRFERECERVRDVADDGLLGVFHVGSTAIRGVPGKPVLDVIAVFADESAKNETARRLLEASDYEGDPDDGVLGLWGEAYSVALKLHTRDDEKVRNQLRFRDFLRDHPEERAAYERVKREAVADHADDLQAYTAAKREFVMDVLERAREAGYDERLPTFA